MERSGAEMTENTIMDAIETNILEGGLHSLGISDYQGKQIDQLISYYRMVVSVNKSFNLTAITDWEGFVNKHFLDSLSIVQTGINLKQNLNIIDIGTGAVFPGIPLKIMFPELQLTLLDSLKKRVGFLEDVVSELDLGVVSCFHGRAEEFGRDPAHREKYSLSVSRAVANYSILLEYALPLTEVGGRFIAYKAGDVRDEIEQGRSAEKILGGDSGLTQKTKIPGTDIERTFVIVEKKMKTPETYPRRAAKIKRGGGLRNCS